MNFWNNFYLKNETTWGFEPSDSALICKDYFIKQGIKSVLILGVGYGRNAKPFYDSGFELTGIEISEKAIKLAKETGFDFLIHHGSITEMPFDNKIFDGIFCYATLHLLNKAERTKVLLDSYNQLKNNGLMFFNVVSVESQSNFVGESIDENILKLENGLEVTFYNLNRIEEEFKNYNIIEVFKIDEPIKHIIDQKPLKCFNVICKKN